MVHLRVLKVRLNADARHKSFSSIVKRKARSHEWAGSAQTFLE